MRRPDLRVPIAAALGGLLLVLGATQVLGPYGGAIIAVLLVGSAGFFAGGRAAGAALIAVLGLASAFSLGVGNRSGEVPPAVANRLASAEAALRVQRSAGSEARANFERAVNGREVAEQNLVQSTTEAKATRQTLAEVTAARQAASAALRAARRRQAATADSLAAAKRRSAKLERSLRAARERKKK